MSRPDLEAVFEHYDIRILPGSQPWLKCQCPMPGHEDRHPSASVNLVEGIWKCHACDTSGNGFTVIRERENLADDWSGVVEFASRFPSEDGDDTREGSRLRGPLSHKPRVHRTDLPFRPSWMRGLK